MSTAQIVFWGPDAPTVDVQFALVKDQAPEGTEISWVKADLPIDEAAEQLKDTLVVITYGEIPFTTELAAKCPNLKLIQSTSAGTNQLDKVGLAELGVKVANNGGGNAVSVAEHTITLMISVFRKFQLQFENVKNGEWMGDIRADWLSQAFEISGKTVGIIGLGRIGSRVAKRLQGWDCEIIYHDPVDRNSDLVEKMGWTKVDKETLLKTADIVSLHVPLNDETKGMISDHEFDIMKPTAVLINACRGPVVDEDAFIRAMEENKIMAAGVDVLEVEPTPEDNPLIDMDNVLITPHLAAFTQEAWAKSRAFAGYNAVRVANGQEPESLINPDESTTDQTYFTD